MTDIVDRLREGILADAFERHVITSGSLTDRLIRERHDAADEIERLQKALRSFTDHLDIEWSQS